MFGIVEISKFWNYIHYYNFSSPCLATNGQMFHCDVFAILVFPLLRFLSRWLSFCFTKVLIAYYPNSFLTHFCSYIWISVSWQIKLLLIERCIKSSFQKMSVMIISTIKSKISGTVMNVCYLLLRLYSDGAMSSWIKDLETIILLPQHTMTITWC
jgi:hypothetical protein